MNDPASQIFWPLIKEKVRSAILLSLENEELTVAGDLSPDKPGTETWWNTSKRLTRRPSCLVVDAVEFSVRRVCLVVDTVEVSVRRVSGSCPTDRRRLGETCLGDWRVPRWGLASFSKGCWRLYLESADSLGWWKWKKRRRSAIILSLENEEFTVSGDLSPTNRVQRLRETCLGWCGVCESS